MKRGAGVQLGLLYQLFCLTLAFYVALAVYGVQADWRNHVGAAAILLSTALVVALFNRYVWDWYFEKRKQTPIPHFLREVFGGLIFLIALLFVLSAGYHAEAQLKGLLAGSGVAAIIIGFAGQNFFAGIIAGMSLQINRPYKVGDWLKIGDTYGEVREINWRSTRLRTNDAINARHSQQRDGPAYDRQSQLSEPRALYASADTGRVRRAAQSRQRRAPACHHSGARRREGPTAADFRQ